MARPNSEFLLAWHSLSGASDELGWRTVKITSASPCQLRAGRRFPGNGEALLVGFSMAAVAAAEKLPEGQGFNVERVDLRDDELTWLALTRKSAGNIDLFLTMVCDCVGLLDAEAASDQPRLLRLFLGRLRAWQEFMRKGAQALSAEAEIGLIGELSFLSSMIAAGLVPELAVESWVGPLDGIQDFELGAGAVEVKSTISYAGFPARIGSLEQLDDAVRQPLFVAANRLRVLASGKNLPDFVSEARTAIAGNDKAESLLTDRLLAAGYFDAHVDRYARRFELAATRIVQVSDGFPRLTAGLVPLGILKAMYEIDLDKVSGESTRCECALKKLGVI